MLDRRYGREWIALPRVRAIATGMAAVLLAVPAMADSRGFRVTGRLEVGVRLESDAIPGEYIVTVGEGAGPDQYGPSQRPLADAAAEAVRRSVAAEALVEGRGENPALGVPGGGGPRGEAGGVILHRYRSAIVGFAARLSTSRLEQLQALPGLRIERNRVVPLPRDGLSEGPGGAAVPAMSRLRPLLPTAFLPAAQPVAPAGLDRIDTRLLPLDGEFRSKLKGTNVHVYVIDTGIFAGHSEFGGRVRPDLGYNAARDGGGTQDCSGHGTGVASVIGGNTLGVASGAILHPVRVFPCTGARSSTADVLAGVDWVAGDRVRNAVWPALVNVSLRAMRSSASDLLDRAIRNSVTVGKIPYIIAAGNDATNACLSSPALVREAITVGNIKASNDHRMVDSNHGDCVDLFAPGVNIAVAGISGVNSRASRSGTSFAAPHVAGVVALYLQARPKATPDDVWTAILAAANKRLPGQQTPFWCGIPNRGMGSPDVLLHWGSGSADGLVDLKPPVAVKGPVKC